MRLKIEIELDNGEPGRYLSCLATASRIWSVEVPNDDAEMRLIGAVNSLVSFEDAIGRLCEELAAKEQAGEPQEPHAPLDSPPPDGAPDCLPPNDGGVVGEDVDEASPNGNPE